MHIDLENKNALVCGSTQGIGYATAMALASAGANVTLVARNEDKLTTVLSKLPAENNQKHGMICADFSDPLGLSEKVNAAIESSEKFHILVNNTGGPPGGEIFTATLEQFELAFTQHLKCNHLLTQAVVPGMKLEKFGRIINIISTSVKQPIEGLGVSNTTRGAVASWAKTMANELGPFGITVNNVLPGATATERLSSIIRSKAEKIGQTVEQVTESMQASIPLRRIADASELANVVCFLASEQASYITGVNLPVDGGRTKSL